MQGKSTKSEHITFAPSLSNKKTVASAGNSNGQFTERALRWLVDNARKPTAEEVQAGSASGRQPERAPVAA